MKKLILISLLLFLLCCKKLSAQTFTIDVSSPENENGYNITCYDGYDGILYLTINGGVAPYNLYGSIGDSEVWDLLEEALTDSFYDFYEVPANTYHLILVDYAGDSATANITLTQAPPIEIDLHSPTFNGFNIPCYDGNLGQIATIIRGGTGPFSFLWNTGSEKSSLDSLTAGTYTLTVTDGNGCIAEAEKTLTQPDSINSMLFAYPLNCDLMISPGQGVELTIEGGTAPYNYTWNTGRITRNIDTLQIGYMQTSVMELVRIQDANGCLKYDSILVSRPDPISFSFEFTTHSNGYGVSCTYCHDGEATVNPTGGSGTYTYEWSNGQTSNTATGLYPDSIYYLTVRDQAGCHYTDSFTIAAPPYEGLGASIYSPVDIYGYNTSCFGIDTASIDLTVTNGTPPYSYAWNNGATTEDLTGLSAGEYTVTIIDSHSDTLVSGITLTSAPELVIDLYSSLYNGFNLTCYGNNQGTISINNIWGGISGYSYEWNDENTEGGRDSLAAGIYTLTVTDAVGCVADTAITLTQPDSLQISLNSPVNAFGYNITCAGQHTGEINIEVEGGAAPYSFYCNQTGYFSGNQLTDLGTDLYAIYATDANGCVISDTIRLNEPEALSYVFDITNISCTYCNDGEVTVAPTGGTGTYSYSWNTGDNINHLEGLFPDSMYVLTVTDEAGCSKTDSFSLSAPGYEALNLQLYSPTNSYGYNTSCFGIDTASIDLTITGGTPPYSVLWNDSITTEDRNNLAAGNYEVRVIDAHNDTSFANITLITSPQLVIDLQGSNIHCYGGADGSINVNNLWGGVGPYNYEWNDGELGWWNSGTSLDSLAPGVYTLEVTDLIGCVADTFITLTQPDSLQLTLESPVNAFGYHINCGNDANGSINATATGGTSPYFFSWNTGPNTEDLNNLSGGLYSVLLSDNNGCFLYDTIQLNEPESLSYVFDITNISCTYCNDGEATVNPTGGTGNYSYSWSTIDNDNHIEGLYPDSMYILTVTDEAGCSKVDSFSLQAPPYEALNLQLYSPTDMYGYNTSCFGIDTASIALTVTGGTPPYTFLWNDSVITEDRNNLPAGFYEVRVIDNYNDTAFATISLTSPSELLIDLYSPLYNGFNLSCYANNQGTISINNIWGGISGYTYEWNDENTEGGRDSLAAGIYTLTVTDAFGCIADTAITLTQPDSFQVALSSPANAFGYNLDCAGTNTGEINLNVEGGTTPYTLYCNPIGYFEGNQITNLDSGLYPFYITDANGCVIYDTIHLSAPDVLSFSFDVTNVSCYYCHDGEVTVAPTGGTGTYSYSWSTGDNVNHLEGLFSDSMYVLTVTDETGCSKVDSFSLQAPGYETLSAWLGSTPYPSNYSISCFGELDGTIESHVSGGTPPYTYLWNDSVTTTANRTGLGAGLYSVTVTDSLNETVVAYIELQQPPEIVVQDYSPLYNGYDIACHGDSLAYISLGVWGGTGYLTYFWNNGSTEQYLDSLSAGTYTFTVNDTVSGCSVVFEKVLTQPDNLQSSIAGPEENQGYHFTCGEEQTGTIDLTVSGGVQPYSYFWNNWSYEEDLDSLGADYYSVQITDANGCLKYDDITLVEPEVLEVTVINQQYPNGEFFSCDTCNDGDVFITVRGGVEPYTFEGNLPSQYQAEDAGFFVEGFFADSTYNFNITDALGCVIPVSVMLPRNAQQNGSLPVIIVTKSEFAGGYNIGCNGCNNGWITLQGVGGTPPYSFAWEDHNFTPDDETDRDSLIAGYYLPVVYDAAGHATFTRITMLQPPPFSVNLVNSTQTCNGSTQGNLYAYVSGGTPPYEYKWVKDGDTLGTTWETHYTYETGNYKVIVTDANYNSLEDEVTVTHRQPVSVSVEAVELYGNNAHTACSINNGSINVSVQGGNPPYNVQVRLNGKSSNAPRVAVNSAQSAAYQNNGTVKSFNTSDTLFTVDSLWAGWYEVRIHDVNNCSQTYNSVELRNSAAPRIEVTGNEYENGYYVSCDTCHDATLNAEATGGSGTYTYTWYEMPEEQSPIHIEGATLFLYDNGDMDVTGLPEPVATGATVNNLIPETIYVLTAVDGHGCAAATNVILDKPKPIQAWGLRGNVADSTFILGSVNPVDLRIAANDTVRMVITAEGNVEVKNSLSANRYLPAIGDSLIHFGETSILMRPTGNNKWIGTNTNTDLSFKTSNTSRLVFKGNGDINLPDFTFIPDSNNAFKILGIDENGNLKSLYLGPLGPKDGPPSACSPILPWTKAPVGNGVSDVNIALCDQYQNVGIGYINPQFKLQVNGDAGFGSVRIGNINNSIPDLQYYNLYVRELSIDNPNSNNPSHTGIRMDMRTSNIAIDLYSIDDQKSNFRVFGNGEVYARDVKVRGDVFPQHPDYVFESDYKLMPLHDLEKYLITNKHLPEIPSAQEVEVDGYSLGNMNIALLKKIEELTLYMINANKENEALKHRMAQLERELQNK